MPTELHLYNAAAALGQVGQVTFSDPLPVERLFLAVGGELHSRTPLQGLLKHGSSSLVW